MAGKVLVVVAGKVLELVLPELERFVEVVCGEVDMGGERELRV